MRIAYIYQFLTLGGVSVQLRNRIRYFSREDVECACFFLHDRGGGILGDIVPVTIDSNVRRLLNKVEEWNPDFIATIDSPQVYGNLEQRDLDCCWINEMHTTTRIASYYRKLKHMKNVRGFIVPSAYLRDLAVSEHGLAADKVRVVPNCVDTSLFSPRPVHTVPDKKILCWIGKLDAHKNWREFIALCTSLASKRDDIEFWLIGGDTATGRVVSQLIQCLAESGLTGKVRWIDRVEQDRMPYLFSLVSASGGALAVTSKNESFGMTVLEAMACKCPVVCTRVGALPELVTHNESGFLYERGNIDELMAGIERVLDEQETRSCFTGKAQAGIAGRYTLRAVGDSYVDALRKFSQA
jgi:glycosyltransferase involved in cell wall biosynthesis